MRTRAHSLPAPEPGSRHLLWAGVVLLATITAGFLALRSPSTFPDAERSAKETFVGWLRKEKEATEIQNVTATLYAASTGSGSNPIDFHPSYLQYRVEADFKTHQSWQRATGFVRLSGSATDLNQGFIESATVRIDPLLNRRK